MNANLEKVQVSGLAANVQRNSDKMLGIILKLEKIFRIIKDSVNARFQRAPIHEGVFHAR
jgi:hypothetical protein